MPVSFSMRVAVAPEVMFRQVGEESVILNLKKNTYLGLDPVGTRMWILLTELGSIQAAYDSLLAEYDIGAEPLRHDLDEFLGRLLENDLVQITGEQASEGTQAG